MVNIIASSFYILTITREKLKIIFPRIPFNSGSELNSVSKRYPHKNKQTIEESQYFLLGIEDRCGQMGKDGCLQQFLRKLLKNHLLPTLKSLMKSKDINEGLFEVQKFQPFLQTQVYFLDQVEPSSPMSYCQTAPPTLTFYFLSLRFVLIQYLEVALVIQFTLEAAL